jgi:NADH-quinone oxidoreductase subunit G
MTTEVVDMITVVIDGFEVTVPKGTLVIVFVITHC